MKTYVYYIPELDMLIEFDSENTKIFYSITGNYNHFYECVLLGEL
jgi:hypothetical protein